MLQRLKTYFSYVSHLVFPNNCIVCTNNLLKNEKCICTICEHKLPYTQYHTYLDNPIAKKLWGRVPLEFASSLLFFEKGLDVQTLISALKYQNRPDVGIALAKIYSQQLQDEKSLFPSADYIVSIPLHPKKLRKRGYNQCHQFAQKLGEELGIKVNQDNCYRKINTISQTGKNRINRWENVAEIFGIKNPQLFENKHIVIVDDVITTGATLEALANQLLKIKGVKISVLLMATAV